MSCGYHSQREVPREPTPNLNLSRKNTWQGAGNSAASLAPAPKKPARQVPTAPIPWFLALPPARPHCIQVRGVVVCSPTSPPPLSPVDTTTTNTTTITCWQRHRNPCTPMTQRHSHQCRPTRHRQDLTLSDLAAEIDESHCALPLPQVPQTTKKKKKKPTSSPRPSAGHKLASGTYAQMTRRVVRPDGSLTVPCNHAVYPSSFSRSSPLPADKPCCY